MKTLVTLIWSRIIHAVNFQLQDFIPLGILLCPPAVANILSKVPMFPEGYCSVTSLCTAHIAFRPSLISTCSRTYSEHNQLLCQWLASTASLLWQIYYFSMNFENISVTNSVISGCLRKNLSSGRITCILSQYILFLCIYITFWGAKTLEMITLAKLWEAGYVMEGWDFYQPTDNKSQQSLLRRQLC